MLKLCAKNVVKYLTLHIPQKHLENEHNLSVEEYMSNHDPHPITTASTSKKGTRNSKEINKVLRWSRLPLKASEVPDVFTNGSTLCQSRLIAYMFEIIKNQEKRIRFLEDQLYQEFSENPPKRFKPTDSRQNLPNGYFSLSKKEQENIEKVF